MRIGYNLAKLGKQTNVKIQVNSTSYLVRWTTLSSPSEEVGMGMMAAGYPIPPSHQMALGRNHATAAAAVAGFSEVSSQQSAALATHAGWVIDNDSFLLSSE